LQAIDFLGVVFTAGIAGVTLYGLVCAVHVWRQRRLHEGGTTPAWLSGPLGVTVQSLTVLGGVLLAGALLAVLLQDRDGSVEARAVFGVRTPGGLEVARLTDAESVQEGEPLAWFRSPPREAERSTLALRAESLQAQLRILEGAPLPVDPELARRQLDAHAERRHLHARLAAVAADLDQVDRERAHANRERVERLRTLDAELERLIGNLKLSEAALARAHERLRATVELHGQELISDDTVADRRHEVTRLELELEATRSLRERRATERRELEEAATEIDQVTAGQAATLRGRLEGLESQRQELVEELDVLAAALRRDRATARARRGEELRRTELQLKEVTQEQEALNRVLTVHAPFAGRVVYRNPSPGTGLPGQAQLALAGAGGIRLRVRLPGYEATALAQEPRVVAELGGELPRLRFPARPISTEPVFDESDRLLVELACDLPREGLRELLNNEPVLATIRWQPPLWKVPVALLGFFILLVAGALCAFALWRGRSAPLPTSGSPQEEEGIGFVVLSQSELVACGALENVDASAEPIPGPTA
jgi:hypothetical protein